MATMTAAPPPYAIDETGLRLSVRLTPRAGRDALDGVLTDADGRPVLGIRVASPPVDGAANAALVAYLARTLGVRKSDVTLLAGETARLKRLHVSGDGPALAARLAGLIAAFPGLSRGRGPRAP